MRDTVAVEIFNTIVDSEGGTLSKNGAQTPNHGYFVGGACEPLIFDSVESTNSPLALSLIQRFVEHCPSDLIGWWIDEADGKVYIDGTDWFDNQTLAIVTGRERGEIAIWDANNNEEIRVEYDAE